MKQMKQKQNYRIITEYAEHDTAMKVTFIRSSEPDNKPVAFEMASFYEEGEHNICVSTLAGCSRMCTFCSVPSYRGFDAYLTPQEIVLQVAYAIHTRNSAHRLPNVVGLMGNGEPFGNMKLSAAGKPYLFEALQCLTCLPIDRMTISTVGDRPDVLQKFTEFAKTLQAPFPLKLQFSLQTPFDEERKKLIPTAKPVKQTIKVCDAYTAVYGQPVTYNLVLLAAKDGAYTNATSNHAKAVAALLRAPSLYDGTSVLRIPKLSVYNPFPGSPFVPVLEAMAQRYIQTLRDNGVTAIKTFQGRGAVINEMKNTGGFSCGQLAVTTPNTISSLSLCNTSAHAVRR